MIVWYSYMLQFITTCLAGGSNSEMYIIIYIERAGKEFQTGNKNMISLMSRMYMKGNETDLIITCIIIQYVFCSTSLNVFHSSWMCSTKWSFHKTEENISCDQTRGMYNYFLQLVLILVEKVRQSKPSTLYYIKWINLFIHVFHYFVLDSTFHYFNNWRGKGD